MKLHENMITHMWCRKEDPTDNLVLNETLTLLLNIEHIIVDNVNYRRHSNATANLCDHPNRESSLEGDCFARVERGGGGCCSGGLGGGDEGFGGGLGGGDGNWDLRGGGLGAGVGGLGGGG